MYKFQKATILIGTDPLEQFSTNLLQFGVSLNQYKEAFELPHITMQALYVYICYT